MILFCVWIFKVVERQQSFLFQIFSNLIRQCAAVQPFSENFFFSKQKEQLDILTRDDRIGINCSNWLAFEGETLTDKDKMKHQVS